MINRNFSGNISVIAPGGHEEFSVDVFGIGLGFLTDLPLITVEAICQEGSSADDSTDARIILTTVITEV